MPKEQLKAIYNNTNAYGDILDDIQSNGEILKEVTGKDVTSISWPYGFYTTTLDNAVKSQLGYADINAQKINEKSNNKRLKWIK